jgi:hypothetical protein
VHHALVNADEGGRPAITAFTHVAVRAMDDPRDALVDQTVIVADGQITALGPYSSVPIPSDAVVVSGLGLTLSPGLHDMHVHLEDPADLGLWLSAGVTTVFNMSGTPRHLAWSAEIERGDRAGPHVVTAGPMLDTSDDPLFGLTVAVPDAATAAAVVRSQVAAGYDFIKVHGDISLEAYRAAMATATELHVRVVGHVPDPVGLRTVLSGGQASIEHAEEVMLGAFDDGFDASDLQAIAREVARSGVSVTPTLVSVESIQAMLERRLVPDRAAAQVSPVTRAYWCEANNPYLAFYTEAEVATFPGRVAFQEQLVRALHRAGTPLLVGTDAGWVPWVIPGASVHEELQDLVRAGVPREDALVGATRAAGAFLGTGAGVVAVGRPADLVLTAGDPLTDFTAFERIDGVMVAGRWYDRPALDALAPARPPDPISRALTTGDWAGATELAAWGLADHTLSADAAHVVALTLARLGHADDAVEVLEAVVDAWPGAWDAELGLARVAALNGDSVRARALRRDAIRAAPHAADAAVREGLPKAG